VKGDQIVHIVDIGGIDDHHCFNYLFIIRMFRMISIPSNFFYFRSPDNVILMAMQALDFRCQCTQQNLQSICAVLTFDFSLKKSLHFL
jgi:hypothetical protein